MKRYLLDFLFLFFPNSCLFCNRTLESKEKEICLHCLLHLPKTNYHLQSDNPVSKLFWGKLPIHHASSYLYFNKGSDQQRAIHQFKYYKKERVGQVFGEMYGNVLKESEHFKNADVIIPVPLTKKKKRKRGYNQSEIFGKSLAKAMNIDMETNCLIKTNDGSSQTRKSKYDRWQNVKDCYDLKAADQLIGKHLLVVDDVITTGSTLEACCSLLATIPDVKVSVVTMACAN